MNVTTYILTSISLRADEQKALAELMQKYGLNRHAVIKLVLRRFLFPNEKTDILLDDHAATVQDGSIKLPWDAKKPKTVDDDPFIFP